MKYDFTILIIFPLSTTFVCFSVEFYQTNITLCMEKVLKWFITTIIWYLH